MCQMPFVEGDDMIEEIAPAAYHPTLRDPVLPRSNPAAPLRLCRPWHRRASIASLFVTHGLTSAAGEAAKGYALAVSFGMTRVFRPYSVRRFKSFFASWRSGFKRSAVSTSAIASGFRPFFSRSSPNRQYAQARLGASPGFLSQVFPEIILGSGQVGTFNEQRPSGLVIRAEIVRHPPF